MLKVPSQQSLIDSDHGSNDSILADLEIEELNDIEFELPQVDLNLTLEEVLNDIEDGGGDGNGGDSGSRIITAAATPTSSLSSMDAAHGSILRHSTLRAVSTQIASAAERVGAGLASAVCVSQMIAVGTAHGFVLCFDASQTLRWCSKEMVQEGAVSALAFNDDDTRLLVGFARGRLVMMESAGGRIMRSMTTVVAPNTGILHIRWTEQPSFALCSDSGGSVWSLNFTRRLGVRGVDSRCLFSGARGEVCTFEPMLLNGEDHPLAKYTIAALATLSKFFVVMIRPRLRVIKFHPLAGPPTSLPLLSWQLVLIQLADSTKTVDPVLAAARGSNVFFHQLAFNGGKVSLLFLRHVTLEYSLIAAHWMGPKTIAYVDTLETLHLSDVRTGKELESMDLSDIGLVYASAQFKGLATGGNVSPAFALAGSQAAYNSVVSFVGQLYVLGGKSLHMISARAWSERLTHLTATQRWDEAIEIALEGYKNAVDKHRRQHIAKERILELIRDFLKATTRTPELHLSTVMDCLIKVGELETLFETLWDRLYSTELYLTIITGHVERGDLKRLSPAVAQALCDFWLERDPRRLEELILKLDWTCLDLHKILTLAKGEKKMFRAQIYLHANALGDFAGPLIDLIPLIATEDPSLGNHLLVYISGCLVGQGYPSGEIPEKIRKDVKHEVLRTLTAIHSNNSPDDELPYPYLRALLDFNVRETLNTFALAFEEREFSGSFGLSHRQRIINILMEILTPSYASLDQLNCLFNFISRQLASCHLPDSDHLLDKVFDYLSRPPSADESRRQHADREQAWLELLTAAKLTHIPPDEMIGLAREAKCCRVLEWLLEETARYAEVLECYVDDPSRHEEAFRYISRHAQTEERQIGAQIQRHFDLLLQISPTSLAKVVVDHFESLIGQLKSAIQDRRQRFNFLQSLTQAGVSFEDADCEQYIDLLAEFQPEQLLAYLRASDAYRIDRALEAVRGHPEASVFLHEKKGDFVAAFEVLRGLVEAAPDDKFEDRALELSGLCTRASAVLGLEDRESLWFELLRLILARRCTVTKTVLHAASTHVDLVRLVELVMNTGGSNSNFGDIKEILVNLLRSSSQDLEMHRLASRIQDADMVAMLEREMGETRRGVAVHSIKCVLCRKLLGGSVRVFGSCGHAVHEECCEGHRRVMERVECPRCGGEVEEDEPIRLPEPKLNVFGDWRLNRSSELDTKAPSVVGERKN